MSMTVLVLVILIALPVIWFVAKVIMGATISPEISGKAVLKEKLKEHNVDTRNYSENFITDVVRMNIVTARGISAVKMDHFSNAFVDGLDSSAFVISQYERGQLGKGLADGQLYDLLRQHRPVTQQFEHKR